jgi:F0F1-type ATP synthase gamma subunit
LVAIGRKASDYFRVREFPVAHEERDTMNQLSPADGPRLGAMFMKAFTSGQVDDVWLVYNKFVSVLRQEITFEQLLPIGLQIVSMYAGTKGFMDKLKVSAIGAFEPHMHSFVEAEGADLLETIVSTGKLDDEVAEKLGALIQKSADLFLKEHPEAGVAEH